MQWWPAHVDSRGVNARRRDHFRFDRTPRRWLNLVEKINCVYCCYGNGLDAYFSVIASRTEQYWCLIKHSRRIAHAQARYSCFLDYSDADAFGKELEGLRDQLRHIESGPGL